MRRRLIVRFCFFIFILFMSISFGENESKAVNIVYDSETEESYADIYKGIAYHKISDSPIDGEAADGVDLATGQLSILRCDLYLEGTGGMDFSLNRYYNSNEANLGLVTVEEKASNSNNIYTLTFTGEDGKSHTIKAGQKVVETRSKALRDMFYDYTVGKLEEKSPTANTQITKVINRYPYHVYGIGAGWSFDFPWIETTTVKEGEKKDWGRKPVYLHFGSKGTLPITTTEDAGTKSYVISSLEGYGYNDIQFMDYNQTVDGIACRYLLRDRSGMRTYFNQDGVVVLQKDCHDNTITYTYKNRIYFDTITDSVGRKIEFQYQKPVNGMSFLKSVTVSGKKAEGGVSKMKTTYETEEAEYRTMDGKTLTGCILTGVTASGEKETYQYKQVETLNNAAGNEICTQRSATNQSYLLNKIQSSGTITCYEYRAGAIHGEKNPGEGVKRDVVTQFHYVTREYEQDSKTKKKANGVKYDYYQKSGNQMYGFYGFYDNHDLIPYETTDITNLTLVSSYNPRTHKDKKRVSDYIYKESALSADTLQLINKPKKMVNLYNYNKRGLLIRHTSEGKTKQERCYTYDRSGTGRLIEVAEELAYGTNRNGTPVSTKEAYGYDIYGNETEIKSQAAFLPENADKQHLFTTTYTYYGAGYPAEDRAYCLELVKETTGYLSASTQKSIEFSLAENSVDVSTVTEKVKEQDTERILSQSVSTYDTAGNETSETTYPDYQNSRTGESIKNTYRYNGLGQRIKDTVTVSSRKYPLQNTSYIEEETTYDDFGNSLTSIDKNGLVTRCTYEEETGEATETSFAEGTEFETKSKDYVSEDGTKRMSIDTFGYGTVEINDAFGNPILEKNEKEHTWTERTYDYGTGEEGEIEENEEETDEVEDTTEKNGLLIEERVYSFEPEGKFLQKDETGEDTPNYNIGGKGTKIKTVNRYFYNEEEEQIGKASFSGGMEPEYCTGFSLTETSEEVVNGQVVEKTSTKEINPDSFREITDKADYYHQFDAHLLSETRTETILNGLGQTLSENVITKRKGGTIQTETTYVYDSFGLVTQENTITKKEQSGETLPQAETQTLYTYNGLSQVAEITRKQKKTPDSAWEVQRTKSVYDDNGQLIQSYDARGTEEDYKTTYEYDLNGQVLKEETPLVKTADGVTYGVTKNEYDRDGNLTATEEKQKDNTWVRTEYSYDKMGQLVLVKNCLEGDKAQYTQYVYDVEGNKIRQYTGMTEPLAITVTEGEEGRNEGEKVSVSETFTCHGKKYHLTVKNGHKKNVYSEIKYEYNERNELVRITDGEGRMETYAYDEDGNLVTMVDKNRTKVTYTYDNQGRMIKQTAVPEKKASTVTPETITHTYEYDAYGDLVSKDNRTFSYQDVSGNLTCETEKKPGRKAITKTYGYDTLGNETSFRVAIGDVTALSCRYGYDGFSRLVKVTEETGDKSETLATYTYDANSNLSGVRYEKPGLSTSYTYDAGNRLSTMSAIGKTGEELSSFHATYSLNNQKLKETGKISQKKGEKTSSKEATYSYDLLGRLTKESISGGKSVSYTYDSFNNRKEMKTGNRVTAYRYNKNNELLRTDELNTETERNQVTKYCYDKNGNQLSTVSQKKQSPEGETVIGLDITLGENRINDNMVNHYDACNRLTSTLTKDNKVSYEYNEEGLRTGKTVNGRETTYVWDGDQMILELNEKDEVTKRYLRGTNLICADSGRGTEKTYYLFNSHGDVVQLTDEEGNITKTYEYDSFGNEVKPDKKDDNPFRYSGEYYDKETGIIYLRARSYEPATGRFTTRDSYTGEEDDPLSLHLYTYCENDGVNQVDPSGHWSSKIHTGVTRLIAQAIGFQNEEANDIAKGCQFGDKRATVSQWNEGIGVKLTEYKYKIKNTTFAMAKKKIKRKKKSNKIKGHMDGLTDTSKDYKINIQEPTQKLYAKIKKKSKIALSKDFTWKQYSRELFIAGVWLHGLQDRWTHRTVEERAKYGFKHPKYTDDYRYDYDLKKNKFKKVPIQLSQNKLGKLSNMSARKLLKKNKRLWHTMTDTQKYISNMRKSLESQNVGGFKSGRSYKSLYRDIIWHLNGYKELNAKIMLAK